MELRELLEIGPGLTALIGGVLGTAVSYPVKKAMSGKK